MTKALPTKKAEREGARVLLDAAEDGDAAAVAESLAAGARADARLAPGGETPLMRAAARGHEEVARVLLDAGADASARRADGFTPLILATLFGHERVVRLLVGSGADARARTSLGTTAAAWAAARGFVEMADLLREAEAAMPPADAPAAEANAPAARPDAEAETTLAAQPSAARPGEADIFSRKAAGEDGRRGAPTDAAAVVASSRDAEAALSALPLFAGASDEPAGALSSAGVSRPEEPATDVHAAGVSLRLDGRSPAHPSASTFRLGHFLRSWQGSVGAALLLLAFGVAVYAYVRGGAAPRPPAPAAPQQTPAAPQAAAQVPAPTPFTTPTPGFPTPDPQGVMPVYDPALAAPGTAGQPFYVPQPAPGPVPADVPRELTVVSEGGAPAGGEAGRAKRKPEANANAAAPAQGNARGESPAETDARPPRPARTPDPEQRPAPPAAAPNPPPAPQPTPGRGKVIPWPPE
ncbi:MAG TPA: ankyrin repeat domain-containing protein [Pyrinomonadaceae bacterium]|jgi:hypothetical protein